ncbi:MAG: hypothetical protein RIE32_04905 [Phycisphaerales bacterium]
MKKQRAVGVAGCGVACLVLSGCASSRTVVITNTSDQSFEMRREGARTAITIDPGGSTTFEVFPGEPMQLNGLAIQVY